MELGESAVESIEREFFEETGIEIHVKKLFGVYTNYVDSYPNGDEAQTICMVYIVEKKNKDINPSFINEETLELKYFSKEALVEIKLVNQQHADIIEDYFKGKARLN